MEEAFFDTPLYREFAQLDEFSRLPDESTILRFGKTTSPRHRLEKHKLAEQILLTVNELLSKRGLLLKAGTAVDADSGLVHTVRGTSGHVGDVTEGNALLHGAETVAFGDAGYQGIEKRPDAKTGVAWHIAMRPGKRKALDKENRKLLVTGA
jgi:IS5 family transposase